MKYRLTKAEQAAMHQFVSEAKGWLRSTAELMDAGQYEEARILAQRVVDELDPLIIEGRVRLDAEEGSFDREVVSVVAHALNRLNTVASAQGDYALSIELGLKVKRYGEAIEEDLRVVGITINLGNSYASLRDFPKALEYYSAAVEIGLRMSDSRVLPTVYNSIGSLYSFIGDHELSKSYLLKAIAMELERGDELSAAGPIHNLGSLYLAMKDYDKAIENYHRAIEINSRAGNRDWLGSNLVDLGLTYMRIGDYRQAEEHMLRSLELRKDLGAPLDAVYENLGELYSIVGSPLHDDAKAERMLLQANESRALVGSLEYGAYEKLAGVCQRQGRWEECVRYMVEARDRERSQAKDDAAELARRWEQQRSLAERERSESVERERAEVTRRLLDSVLPESIATRMIAGEDRIADSYDNVSVLFADIVGFTALTKDVEAEVVIELLNYVFDRFDDIISRTGCEKIKTIGDGYMAIAGAPEQTADHPFRIALAACEMSGRIPLPAEIQDRLPIGAVIETRIGLHCGPVVCGVVGRERFVWDVYSDAVNTASRMEATGEPGLIHISRSFSEALAPFVDHGESDLQIKPRGEVDIKGKGLMTTYWLESNAKRARHLT